MAVIRFGNSPFFRNPWAEFDRVRREFDSLIRGLDQYRERTTATVFPSLNISEDAGNIYVQAEVPGLDAGDLNIAVEGDTLTISGERRVCPEAEEEKISYHRRELESGSFNRAVTMPCRIEVEKVQAKAANGLLLITLPKAAEAKPRQIEVVGG
jgi:HSP20 family protein